MYTITKSIVTQIISTIITTIHNITTKITQSLTPQINTPHTLHLLLTQNTQLTQQINHIQQQINKINNPTLTEEQITQEEQLASTISPTQTKLQLEEIIYTFLPHPIYHYQNLLENPNHEYHQ